MYTLDICFVDLAWQNFAFQVLVFSLKILKDGIFAMFSGIAFHICVPLHVLVSVSY